MFPLLPKAPKYRRLLVIVGILTITVAMFLASCARTAWLVVLTQGILFGVGGILMNFVHVSIFAEWFEKKKDKAMGTIWLGWRVGSLGFPVVCLWLLDKHGYEKTLRVLIAPMLALLIPAIMLFRGRFAESTVVSESAKPRISKAAVLRSPNVLFYLFVSLLFYLIENVPVMFILTFGVDLKLNSSDQALALSLRVLCTMAGSYVVGRLVDFGYRDSLLAASAGTTSLLTCLIWGYTKAKFGLFSYAVAVGLASGGMIVLDVNLEAKGITNALQDIRTACLQS
jgi:MFS family permease